MAEDIRIFIIGILQMSAEADRAVLGQSGLYDAVQIREGAAANKEDIPGVHCLQRHHGILVRRADRHLHVIPLE